MTSPRMRGPGILAVLLVLSLVWRAPPEAHAWERPVFRFWEGIRANLREAKEDVPNEVVNRAEVDFFKDQKWTVLPFFESRVDVDDGEWSRVEAGGEFGVHLFPWFYLGNGIQQAWLHPDDDRSEWEVRTVLSWPLPLAVRSEKLSLYALNEWTFDIDKGEGQRNEVGVGFRIPLPWKPFSSQLGWRHVDIIHDSDMDQFEGSLRADF